MARLAALPHKDVVAGLAGIVDFYVWGACRGTPIPCARAWPRYDPHAYPSTCQPPRDAFAYIMTHLKDIPEPVVEAYQWMAGGTALNWRDVAVRCYMNAERV